MLPLSSTGKGIKSNGVSGLKPDACRMQQLNYSYYSKDNLWFSANKSWYHRDCIVICNLIHFSYLIKSNVVFTKHNAHASIHKHTHNGGFCWLLCKLN